MLSKGMRHFYLRINFNVTNCFCDFCKEDTNDETVMGSKVDKLLGELEILGNDFGSTKEALFSLFPFSADSNYEELTTDCYTPEKARRLVDLCKGTFLSEDADVFVITPNRRTFFFPETENLNFGDSKLFRN
jgi:hypothetical protein